MQRRDTREVFVGKIGIGGSNPIRIQSMTTALTSDVNAVCTEVFKLVDAGCEIVRFTVQGMKEAHACGLIKDYLLQKGCDIPLVADIHFFPAAAMAVADYVDKVRINPGNFVDKRHLFTNVGDPYNEAAYASDLVKIEERFGALVKKCKQLNIAIRIGVNHGSLSERILQRYGNTTQGMVESALEFTNVCYKLDFHSIVYSMKSSNPKVMIEAYRRLAQEMDNRYGFQYPFHLGVTEAGAGEDGRIKSGAGIGALLLDGIGETIRVSLTEDPWEEISPCKALIDTAMAHHHSSASKPFSLFFPTKNFAPEASFSEADRSILHPSGSVFLSPTQEEITHSDFLTHIGYETTPEGIKKGIATADILVIDDALLSHPNVQKAIQLGMIVLSPETLPLCSSVEDIEILTSSSSFLPFMVLDLTLDLCHARSLITTAKNTTPSLPIILKYSLPSDLSVDESIMRISALLGSLFCDEAADGLLISTPVLSLQEKRTLSFSLLQATGKRLFKTDFISCPGCGRTLFDLKTVSARIRARTAHLPGLKIAIMGCIVNGPGEMADADFGFVGSRPGKVDLYVKHKCVKKEIDMKDADDELIALLKEHNVWQEPLPALV